MFTKKKWQEKRKVGRKRQVNVFVDQLEKKAEILNTSSFPSGLKNKLTFWDSPHSIKIPKKGYESILR